MKTYKGVLLIIVLFLAAQNVNAQIYSTTTGGNWEDTTSWIGYKVPGALDSAIIQGPITLNFDAPTLHDLLISENGSLLNGWVSSFTVTGNVWVNGNVNCPSVSDFKIGGDLHLNGNWKANLLFTGTENHFLSTTPTSVFDPYTHLLALESKIIAASDLYLCGNGYPHIVAKEIDLTAGYSMHLFKVRLGQEYYYINGGIRTKVIGGNNTIYFNEEVLAYTDQYYFEYSDLQDVTLQGKLFFGGGVRLLGEVINADTLKTAVGVGNWVVEVLGNLTNNGNIEDGSLKFTFHNNFTNNGVFVVPVVTFLGMNDHQIITTPGNWIKFTSNFLAEEGKIIAESDLYLSGNGAGVHLVAKEIDLILGHTLYLRDLRVGLNSAAIKTKINGGGNSVYLRGGLNSYYENCDLYDLNFRGYTVFKGNNTNLYGEIVNLDTLTNNSQITLNSYGNFTNHGRMYNSSYDINMNIYGDLTNDSNYSAISTSLVGMHDQNIFLPTDKPLNSMITTFKSELTGATYQWQKNGIDIGNATTNQLVFNSALTVNEYGTYRCIVDEVPSRKVFVGNSAPPAFEIYDVQITNLSLTQTQIEWKTTVPASGFIFYAENDTTNGYPLEAMEPQDLRLQHSLTLENLTTGSTYYFIIDQNDSAWNNIRSIPYNFVAGDSIVGINDLDNVPKEFSLSQNYPNPFNPTTRINFTVPTSLTPTLLTLKIYDIVGNEIATLVNEEKAPGTYEVAFDAAGLTSGVYFYKIQSGYFTQTRKLILIK